MFGKKKAERYPIDIRYKTVSGFFGRKKKVANSKKEQREIKKRLLQLDPTLRFIDDLHENNSVSVDGLSWIDQIEAYDALFH